MGDSGGRSGQGSRLARSDAFNPVSHGPSADLKKRAKEIRERNEPWRKAMVSAMDEKEQQEAAESASGGLDEQASIREAPTNETSAAQEPSRKKRKIKDTSRASHPEAKLRARKRASDLASHANPSTRFDMSCKSLRSRHAMSEELRAMRELEKILSSDTRYKTTFTHSEYLGGLSKYVRLLRGMNNFVTQHADDDDPEDDGAIKDEGEGEEVENDEEQEEDNAHPIEWATVEETVSKAQPDQMLVLQVELDDQRDIAKQKALAVEVMRRLKKDPDFFDPELQDDDAQTLCYESVREFSDLLDNLAVYHKNFATIAPHGQVLRLQMERLEADPSLFPPNTTSSSQYVEVMRVLQRVWDTKDPERFAELKSAIDILLNGHTGLQAQVDSYQTLEQRNGNKKDKAWAGRIKFAWDVLAELVKALANIATVKEESLKKR